MTQQTAPGPITVEHEMEDHRELTRVWDALGITGYNGKSASENVATLKAQNDILTAQLEGETTLTARLRTDVLTLTDSITRHRKEGRSLKAQRDALLAAAEAALGLSAVYRSSFGELTLTSIEHWDAVRAQLRAAIAKAGQ